MSVIDHLREARVHERIRSRVGDRNVIRVQRRLGPLVRWNLTALAHVYWTDKAGGHKYTTHYGSHLSDLRRKRVNLLEIGVGGNKSPTWGGASLRMWRDFFYRGHVHGLDIREKRISEPRITIHRGDQSNKDFMDSLGDEHGPFDVIIDDGSHVNAHIRASFSALFDKHLKPGGWYVIEDMETAYEPRYGGGPPGEDGTSVDLVKNLIDAINTKDSVRSVHVYKNIAFIEKA